MNKSLLLTLILTCWLQSPTLAQSADNSKLDETRTVKDQVLASTYLPALRIKFDNSFKYVGTQKFVLYERAQVEQFFFVDADSQQRIKRMYLVQFEGYLPGIDATYDYPATETVSLGGQTYIVNAESVPNVSAVLKQAPQSDTARAGSFLESKGYRLSESIRYLRFVRLLDDAKRNEFLLIYIEDPGASAAEEKEKEKFSARALKGFAILK